MAFNEATCLITRTLWGPNTATWWDRFSSLFWSHKLQGLSPWLGLKANLVALSNGTQGTQNCIVLAKLVSTAIPLPVPLRLNFHMWGVRLGDASTDGMEIRRHLNDSCLCSVHRLCWTLFQIVFGLSKSFWDCGQSLISPGGHIRKSKAKQGWEYQQQNQIK